jgi:hypothetical protein
MKYQTQIISHFNSIKNIPDYKSYQIYSIDNISLSAFSFVISSLDLNGIKKVISNINSVLNGTTKVIGIGMPEEDYDGPQEWIKVEKTTSFAFDDPLTGDPELEKS